MVESAAGVLPGDVDALGGVVVNEVVERHADGYALGHVALILKAQSALGVLHVTVGKDVTSAPGNGQLRAGVLLIDEHRQLLLCLELAAQHGDMPADGHHYLQAQPLGERAVVAQPDVGIDAEELLLRPVLVDAEEYFQRSEGSPADVESGADMGECPAIDFLQLRPVGYLFIVEVLQRCTGDNHAVVEAAVFHYLRNVGVVGVHVFLRSGLVAQAAHLGQGDGYVEAGAIHHRIVFLLGLLLLRHEVEDDKPQRTGTGLVIADAYALLTQPRH